MNDTMVSKLPDADMQAAPKAMLRAAQRAREIARQTNTPLVLVRDGVLVEEYVTDEPQTDTVLPDHAAAHAMARGGVGANEAVAVGIHARALLARHRGAFGIGNAFVYRTRRVFATARQLDGLDRIDLPWEK